MKLLRIRGRPRLLLVECVYQQRPSPLSGGLFQAQLAGRPFGAAIPRRYASLVFFL